MDDIIKILIDYGILGIMIAAFSEAIFMPLPMELISIPIFLLNPSKALFYSLILILFSTIGSTVGYYIGKSWGKPLLNKLISQNHLQKLNNLYNKNSFITILTSSFTPIPYEAYVLSAGILNVKFKKFITPAIISRVIRHLPQGVLITLFGEAFILNFKNYTLVVALISFLIIVFLKIIFRNIKKH